VNQLENSVEEYARDRRELQARVDHFKTAAEAFDRYTKRVVAPGLFALSPDQRRIAFDHDNVLWVFDMESHDLLFQSPPHKEPVGSLEFSKDGKTLVSRSGNTVSSIRFGENGDIDITIGIHGGDAKASGAKTDEPARERKR
jgi:WD40 repeat protein